MKCNSIVPWMVTQIITKKPVLRINPSYQTGTRWKKAQKQLLLESILSGFPIPQIILRSCKIDGRDMYEIVDGGQRCRTLWDFGEGALSFGDYTKRLKGKTKNDLGEADLEKIMGSTIPVVVIEDATESEIRTLFERLQNGTPLNPAELRNCIGGSIRDFCQDTSKHVFFDSTKITGAKDARGEDASRMARIALVAQMLLLEMAGGPTNIRSKNLDIMYRRSDEFSNESSVAKKVIRVLEFLLLVFPKKSGHLTKSHVVSLYLATSCLMEGYVIKGQEQRMLKFFEWFFNLVSGFDDKAEPMVDRNDRFCETNIRNFAMASRRGASDVALIKSRHNALLGELHLHITDLLPKDTKRAFDEQQRLAIYYRDNGTCAYCNQRVEWDDYHADHVIPHSKGGMTIVENGKTSCQKCNLVKSDKDHGQLTVSDSVLQTTSDILEAV